MTTLEEIQQTAFQLYDMGLNVFPIPATIGNFFPFTFLNHQRVYRDQIPDLFSNPYPIGVYAGNRYPPYFFFLECLTKQSFDEQVAHIRRIGLPIWASQSKQRYYIWFRSKYGRVQNQENDTLKIWGKGRFVIAPSSSQSYPKWILQEGEGIPQIIPYDTLDWLYLEREEESYDPLTQAKLKERIKEKIEEQKRQKESELAESPEEFALTTDKQKKSDSIYRTTAAIAYMQYKYDWSGKIGVTDFSVFCGLLYRIKVYHGIERIFRVNTREIAEYAHTTATTISETLKRFQECNPPILIFKGKDASKSHLYQFSDKVVKQGRALLKENRNDTLSSLVPIYISSPAADYPALLERNALSWQGLYLYYQILYTRTGLRYQGIGVEALTQSTRFPLPQVKRLLTRLQHDALIEYKPESNTYHANELTESIMEKIVSDTGADEKSDARKARHFIDRQKVNGHRILYYFNNKQASSKG